MKKLLLFVVVAVFLAGSFVVLHQYFGTNRVQALTIKTKSQDSSKDSYTFIEYNAIQEYAKQNPEPKVYVLTDKTEDSNYLLNTLIASLAAENKGSALPHLVVVDLSGQKDITITRLKLLFNVETYPALIYGGYDAKRNVIQSTSSIITNPKKPITQQQLKKWFFDNKLWNGPYND